MARAAVLGRLTWRVATVVATRRETATARTVVLDVPDWPGHLAGQHVDIRLTAEDGYTAVRSLLDVLGGRGDRIEVTVDEVEDGEVSPYLTQVVDVGDLMEVRGPIGGWFVWRTDADRADPTDRGRVGHRAADGDGQGARVGRPDGAVPAALLDAQPRVADLPGRTAHPVGGLDITYAYTRRAPGGLAAAAADRRGRHRGGHVARRVGAHLLRVRTDRFRRTGNPTAEAGHDPERISTERFG